MTGHTVQWVTAAPLWEQALDSDLAPTTALQEDRMRRPELVTIASDDFMKDLEKLLADEPRTLGEYVAEPVSHRPPRPGEDEAPTLDQLKLYQAVHGEFNLVVATLVCRMPGLPDREVAPADGDAATFVLRRVDGAAEFAWVEDPDGPKGRSWLELGGERPVTEVAEGEQLLPLFPFMYDQTPDRRRRVFAGLIPTSSGDTFKAAGELSPLAAPGDGVGAPPQDPRPEALAAHVTDPMRALKNPDNIPVPPPELTGQDLTDFNAGIEELRAEASRQALLDFATFLRDDAPDVWDAIYQAAPPAGGDELALYNLLNTSRPDTSVSSSRWRAALKTAWDERLAILGEDPEGDHPTLALNLQRSEIEPDTLDQSVVAALPELPEPDPAAAAGPAVSIQGDVMPAPEVPKLDARAASHYVLRCVFQRPGCGPLVPDVVSDPSRDFTIASFFDFDAPTREIQIALPVDTNIRDLRKFKKNVNFLLSNELRGQMNRITDLKKALDGDLGSSQTFDIGLLCSFSIPIITICALIVLMIFINLLNIVFWWMPFLRICFPIGLKAKA